MTRAPLRAMLRAATAAVGRPAVSGRGVATRRERDYAPFICGASHGGELRQLIGVSPVGA